MSLDLGTKISLDVPISKKYFQQRQIFAQQSKQKVFRLDVMIAVPARLEASEEDNATRLFRVSLKHNFYRVLMPS
jgi:hypothetical protein